MSSAEETKTAVALATPEGDTGSIIAELAYRRYVFASLIGAVIVLRLVWRWPRHKKPEED